MPTFSLQVHPDIADNTGMKTGTRVVVSGREGVVTRVDPCYDVRHGWMRPTGDFTFEAVFGRLRAPEIFSTKDIENGRVAVTSH